VSRHHRLDPAILLRLRRLHAVHVLSWAGRPLFECRGQVNEDDIVKAVTSIFKAMHKLRVLHRDTEPRNVLYDANSGTVMGIDFEPPMPTPQQERGWRLSLFGTLLSRFPE
jgi:serine/threonine protein kinase